MSSDLDLAWEATRLNNLNSLKEYVPKKILADSKRINEKNHCHSLLMCAAANGSLDCAKYLIENGANVNLKNFQGFTAFHWAAFTGNLEVVPFLIENNADKEARTGDGKTPLHIAAYFGHRKFIDYLLTVGCNINAVDSFGHSALHQAILANQQAMVEYLVSKSIDTSQMDSEKKTLRQFAEANNSNWVFTILSK